MKLLLAEDERDLADALTVLLERNKYAVDTVYNGRDAYEYARTGEYDGVILDIMMPQLTGLQVVTRLREDGVSTPVMLLTAKGQKDDRITGFDAGADDYLPSRLRRMSCSPAYGRSCAAAGIINPLCSPSARSRLTAAAVSSPTRAAAPASVAGSFR